MKTETTHSYKALILAGGRGTRLRPVTDATPKCLVTIHGRPMLDYWVEALADCDVPDALINTHHHRGQVADYIEAVNRDGRIRLVESFEPELLGSAGTIANNQRWMDDADHCIVLYADNLSNVDLRAMRAFHESHDDPLTMMLFRTSNPEQCGIAELDASGRVVSFTEKPKHPKSNLANAGVYILSAEAWREIADMNAFDIGFDVLPWFVGRMRGWAIEGYHRDIGNLDALEAARREAPAIFAAESSAQG